MSTTSSSTPVERATRRCSKSPVIVRSFGFVSKPEWPQRCEPTSLSVRSGVGRRLRHSGQRDIFLAIAGNEREFTILPVLQIGREHVCTPVPNAHLVCLLLREKTKIIY